MCVGLHFNRIDQNRILSFLYKKCSIFYFIGKRTFVWPEFNLQRFCAASILVRKRNTDGGRTPRGNGEEHAEQENVFVRYLKKVRDQDTALYDICIDDHHTDHGDRKLFIMEYEQTAHQLSHVSYTHLTQPTKRIE